MRIVISGSHGLVGKALIKALEADGHEIYRLVRHAPNSEKEIEWSPDRYSIAISRIEGFDAVYHLAGESIASGRWNDEKKRKIRESRTKGTKLLADALANLSAPPKTLISASATGYYGDRGDELLTETSPPGKGFLADVCTEWEQATEHARVKGVRVVNTRFGIILDKEGGALAKMLTPFRMGIGGRIGDGKQWMSWIALDDVIGALKFALNEESMNSPVNFVAPNPVTNAEFTKTLGRVLSRPTLFPIPEFGVRLAFGEMADALLLSSQRVEPAILKQSGFKFRFADLPSTLQAVLS
ncbi:MAG: TIGR01777 family oxidoreductase [Pyrinomonadaceae bacterium]